MNTKEILTKDKQAVLFDALYYMKMPELRTACSMLLLSDKGKKIDLIRRITNFICSGEILNSLVIPKQSRASNYPVQELNADALILYGGYKNDAKTRSFFKSLIGDYFHFTAFGIDWLNDRWISANPPTYGEFAAYWIKETKHRKQSKPKPKDEWKYINFLQQMNKEFPFLSKSDLMNRWKKLQKDKSSEAFDLLKSIT